MSKAKQKVIAILGMHRSGTSAITRALNLLGAYLGPPEKMMPPRGDNPEGFWEHADIVDLHDRLLLTLASNWYEVSPLPRQWWRLPEVKPYHAELAELIQREFAEQPLWMWKDPRTCLTLPLWQAVCAELGVDLSSVIILRNPLDVAASLQRRDHFSLAKSLALWQLYNLSALYWTNRSARLVIHYDTLLTDWEPCLRKISQAFDLPWPDNPELKQQLASFLQPSLRHSLSSVDTVLRNKDVPPAVASTYLLLRQAEASDGLLGSEEFAEKITALYTEYCATAKMMLPPLLQVYWTLWKTLSGEDHGHTYVIADGEFHQYEISVTEKASDVLRLDPVNIPAYVEISALDLLRYRPHSSETIPGLCWHPGERFCEVKFGPNTRLIENTGQVLCFLAMTDDPQLFLQNIPLEPEGESGKTTLRITMRVEHLITEEWTKILADRQAQEEAEYKKEVRLAEAKRRESEATLAQVRTEIRLAEAKRRESEATLAQARGEVRLVEAKRRESETTLAQVRAALGLREETTTLTCGQIEELKKAIRHYRSPSRKLRSGLTYLKRFFRWPRVHDMRLEPVPDSSEEDNGLRAAEGEPRFLLRSSRGHMPEGWVEISYQMESFRKWLHPSLYVDAGAGFLETQKITLPRPFKVLTLAAEKSESATPPSLEPPAELQTEVRFLVFLSGPVHALRLHLLTASRSFFPQGLRMREIGTAQMVGSLLWRHLRPFVSRPALFLRMIRRSFTVLRREGFAVIRRRFLLQEQGVGAGYQEWIDAYDRLTTEDRAAIRRYSKQLAYKPLMSVVMPTYNTSVQWLRLAIESVRNQLYPHWELCIADDASSAPQVRQLLEQYRLEDERIKVVYREKNGHISAASNSAIELATGDFIALLDHDDELAEHALYMVAVELNAHPDAALIYSDEDKLDEAGLRYSPYFKSDWNPDLFLCQNCVSHLGVYRTQLVREVGGFREGYEGCQDWDLALRVAERVSAAQIRHIPHVLYHWRAISGSTALAIEQKTYAQEAQYKMLMSHFAQVGMKVQISLGIGSHWRIKYPLPQSAPLVSLIIPTRDHVDLLRRCVESIYQKTLYPNFELLIIDNQSDEAPTLDYLRQLASERKVRVLRYDAPFNYSAINNFAVRQARGELIGLLNNDLEVIAPGWLEEMVNHALRPEIGAVGAMLYYPNETIQHAGVILGVQGVAGHAYAHKPRGTAGQVGRAFLTQNLSAVTAACLVMRRALFVEVEGLDEKHLPIAFNDIDLCLRLKEKGYENVWTPYAELYHHESASRGSEDSVEKQTRFQQEIDYMQKRWGDSLQDDPAYNPNLTLESGDFTLAFPPRSRKPWR